MTENVSSSASSAPTQSVVVMSREELMSALKKQIEFYFSKENLYKDRHLLMQMNEAGYVHLKVIANFKMVRTLTSRMEDIAEALVGSTIVSLDETNSWIKPNITVERKTLILRDIANDVPEEEIRDIFKPIGAVEKVKSEVGDTWFVTMESEEVAVTVLQKLNTLNFRGNPIKARLKSENVGKMLLKLAGEEYPMLNNQPMFNQYGQPVYDQNMYNSFMYMMPQQQPQQQTAPIQQQQQQSMQRMGGGMGYYPNYYNNQYNDGMMHSMNRDHGVHDESNRRGGRRRRGMGGSGNPVRRDSGSMSRSENRTVTSLPPLSSSLSFPPLISTGPGGIVQSKNENANIVRYSAAEILSITRDMKDLSCPPVATPGDHSIVLLSAPVTDLIEKGRTQSMDQAMLEGPPRSLSVDSVDYTTMMMGDLDEHYTNQLKQNKQNEKKMNNNNMNNMNMNKNHYNYENNAGNTKLPARGYAGAVKTNLDQSSSKPKVESVRANKAPATQSTTQPTPSPSSNATSTQPTTTTTTAVSSNPPTAVAPTVHASSNVAKDVSSAAAVTSAPAAAPSATAHGHGHGAPTPASAPAPASASASHSHQPKPTNKKSNGPHSPVTNNTPTPTLAQATGTTPAMKPVANGGSTVAGSANWASVISQGAVKSPSAAAATAVSATTGSQAPQAATAVAPTVASTIQPTQSQGAQSSEKGKEMYSKDGFVPKDRERDRNKPRGGKKPGDRRGPMSSKQKSSKEDEEGWQIAR